MFGWLKNLFSRDNPAEPISMRRWEASKTDRLNEAQWAEADGATINADLELRLSDLRNRCALEIAKNPTVEGVIQTHVMDIVGDQGPVLEVQSDDEQYNDALESIWNEWWECPDLNGQFSGADFLRLWIRSLWSCGEYLAVKTDNGQDDDPGAEREEISRRLQAVHPARLDTPVATGYSDHIVLGIEVNDYGRPLKYWIEDYRPNDTTHNSGMSGDWYPADEIIHFFDSQEPGQLRGVPWLAPSLQSIEDLRSYDEQVLDAARAAADFGVILYTQHPDSKFIAVNESTTFQRRTIRTAPPGWKPEQMKAEQPTTQYVSYRQERQREIGRPVCMPLMMIRLDSTGHNYSSARFDGQLYQRSNRTLQGRIGTRTLNPLVRDVAREAELRRMTPKRPKRVRYLWSWPTPPHVDPQKEATASGLRLSNAISTLTDELTSDGKSLEPHIQRLAKEVEMFAKAGLLHPLAAKSSVTQKGEPDMQQLADAVADEIENRQLFSREFV